MIPKDPLTVFATYRVKSGCEEAFLALVGRHFPVLKRLGLVDDREPRVWVGLEKDGQPIVFEVFTWKTKESPGIAHGSPEVGEIWGAMGELVEERDGKPMFEFPHVAEVAVEFAG